MEYEAAVRRILATAREHLGLEVAWASEFVGREQVFRHVDSAVPGLGPEEGSAGELAGSYCLRVLDGRLPAVVADARRHLVTRDLPVTAALGIGAYVGVPIPGEGGAAIGMLCATSRQADPRLQERDLAVMRMLAAILAEFRSGPPESELAEVRQRVQAAVDGHGRSVALQPVVDVLDGRAVGVEALARFGRPPHRPDLWFADAERVGLRVPLELAAAASALGASADRDGYVGVNVSPDVVLHEGFAALLAGRDLTRVVLELTEHAPVSDYDLLNATLAPYRAEGLRVAVDDAGAGFASFRHILKLSPDHIKIDLSLVRDIEQDPVRQALVRSLLGFARGVGASLVAEGVETRAELDALAALGVRLMQGYLLCRPCAEPPLTGYPTASRGVLVDDGTDLQALVTLEGAGDEALDALARPLLDTVLRLTGLETSYITVLSQDGEELEHRYVRNAGSIDLPEGVRVPWSQSLCSSMQEQGLLWSDEADLALADRPLAAAFGVRTFLSTPVRAPDGRLLGTVCAGGRAPVHLEPPVAAQVAVIAQVVAAQLGRAPARRLTTA